MWRGKDPDAGKDWGQQEKGATEDEMVGWHHWLNGHESERTLEEGEGQGSSPWGCKESGVTYQLKTNNKIINVKSMEIIWNESFSKLLENCFNKKKETTIMIEKINKTLWNRVLLANYHFLNPNAPFQYMLCGTGRIPLGVPFEGSPMLSPVCRGLGGALYRGGFQKFPEWVGALAMWV